MNQWPVSTADYEAEIDRIEASAAPAEQRAAELRKLAEQLDGAAWVGAAVREAAALSLRATTEAVRLSPRSMAARIRAVAT